MIYTSKQMVLTISDNIDDRARIQQDEMTTVTYEEPLLDDKQTDTRARAIILGFECLDSTALNGMANNLVVYLQTVLHGSNASNAANVMTWYGAIYFMPIVGAGTILVTLSAFLIEHQVTCDSKLCDTSNGFNPILFFLGLYLVAFGVGGVQSSLLSFGADQFDDRNPKEREKKQQFFSWYYLCVDFGVISSGTPTYNRKVPRGSPLRSLFQVLVCSLKNVRMELPMDTSLLHENDYKFPKLEHTDEYRKTFHFSIRFLDKAAIPLDSEAENSNKYSEVCTVTQVEEVKILFRLLPIWASGIVYSAAYFQMWTTFIQQGTTMDTKIMSISIPPASLCSFEVLCVMGWVLVYNKLVVPKMISEPTKLQRIGIGYFLIILTMAVAAFVEKKRLESVRNGEVISITWQLPQYFLIAASEMLTCIAQLEFFYEEAPDSMKSMCTSFNLLAMSLGNYLSSLIVTLVTVLTGTDGSSGWIPDDLNRGHLDYFFWSLSCLSVVNFVVYVAFAKRYKIKRIILEM
ncbi:Protein NRT1/ PTR FAMILY 8.5 [Rhynchospora pubera]|uniref:Protein NRT1/ PTR FAMILY 8.5 n=1 Tax=Rhynchospora pubera TaxID=906938 RepID=A0AAV8G386_9POAL|nr:Protein NRT1/ PTR FAMILY 8.5 [Rhynchospora pubera]